MTMAHVLFWFFSLVLLGSGVLVVFSRNPVNSAVFLIQLFLGMAGLFLLLHAFFLAMVQILVYAGAVVVLFLFVIMLLDLKPSSLRPLRTGSMILGAGVGLALAVEMFLILRRPDVLPAPAGELVEGGLAEVVRPLFSQYLLPLELIALIVLASMIGVVALTRRDSP
jgi:NADH-quinone oxidoreductase subunit J